MRTIFNIIGFVALCAFAASPCSAMISVEFVSKARAKELGVTFRSRTNGEAGIQVSMEFKARGELEKITYVRLQVGEPDNLKGDSRIMSAQLPVSNPSPGTMVVTFSAYPDYLPKSTLLIAVYNGPKGDVGYRFKLADFIALENASESERKADLKPDREASLTNVSLTEAVTKLNKRAKLDSIGTNQPALTDDAVVAAIRWTMIDRQKLQVSDATFRQLREITETRMLPKDFDLEFMSGYEPNDEVVFEVWSVRLRIPGGPHPGGSTCITIQEKMIGSRLIGEQERQVIQKWRKKEKARGGIGSMERVQWMREYRAERESAAVADAKKDK